jgi:hypothetical protein
MIGQNTFKHFMKYVHLICCLIVLLFGGSSGISQITLIPVSGADGEFNTISLDGKTIYQSKGTPGNYAYYIYLQCQPEIVNKTVYVELTFKDIGYGEIKIDYNSISNDYKQIQGKNAFLLDLKGEKKVVFQLTEAHFRNAQNLGCDLRIWSDSKIQKHLISAILYEQPTSLWQAFDERYFFPYQGRKYTGNQIVNATTLQGKVICGYQGWFRAPGDPEGGGWVHYFRDQNPSKPTVEMWPDMTEYSPEEKYPVQGWKLKDGMDASLFSSANKKTVLRHFQWMQAYGIHGVAVQRFAAGLYPGHPHDSYRVLSYAREAANRTGRVFYVMYDQSGLPGDLLVDYIKRDWKILVDSMKITKDDRYLKHSGKPIVSIFGYWPDRFTPQVAKQVADIFKQPGYEAHLIGSGERIEVNNTSWNTIYNDFLAYFPWNVGNYTHGNLSTAFAQTQQWQNEKSFIEARGSRFMPLIFPGFAWDNLMNKPPGTTNFGRRKGQVMWQQVRDAANLNVSSLYIAMFDEIDESTAIFKTTNNIPVNHYFLDNEGLPSDFYLNLTGFASSIIAGERAMPATMPDFAKMSQPSIPEMLFPQHRDTVLRNQFVRWLNSIHSSGITGYELKIDNQLYSLGAQSSFSINNTIPVGWHTISIRSKNGLGNFGGWSEVNDFYMSDKLSSVQENNSDKAYINIYPNPTSGIVHINSENVQEETTYVHIYTSDGKLLHHEIIMLNGINQVIIPESCQHNSLLIMSLSNNKLNIKKRIFYMP